MNCFEAPFDLVYKIHVASHQFAAGTPKLCSQAMAATRRRQRKSSDASSTSRPSGRSPRIMWDSDPLRTDRLIDWLEQHPSDRHKLFADSIQDARAEGRARNVSKSPKATLYNKIAEAVFSVDADPVARVEVVTETARYGKGVENRIST